MTKEILRKYGLEHLNTEQYRVIRFKEGEFIVREGDPLSWFGIMLEGKAKIYRNSVDGKNLILSYYIEDGVIGELELLTNQKMITTSVIALSEVTCLVTSMQTYQHEFETNLKFNQTLARFLAGKLDASSNNYASSALCTGEQRVCSCIRQGAVNGIYREMLTETASTVGLSYRHLLRLIDQLCKEKILEKRSNGLHIVDEKILRERAENGIKTI